MTIALGFVGLWMIWEAPNQIAHGWWASALWVVVGSILALLAIREIREHQP